MRKGGRLSWRWYYCIVCALPQRYFKGQTKKSVIQVRLVTGKANTTEILIGRSGGIFSAVRQKLLTDQLHATATIENFTVCCQVIRRFVAVTNNSKQKEAQLKKRGRKPQATKYAATKFCLSKYYLKRRIFANIGKKAPCYSVSGCRKLLGQRSLSDIERIK